MHEGYCDFLGEPCGGGGGVGAQGVRCNMLDALDATLHHVSGHLPEALDATLQHVSCHLLDALDATR